MIKITRSSIVLKVFEFAKFGNSYSSKQITIPRSDDGVLDGGDDAVGLRERRSIREDRSLLNKRLVSEGVVRDVDVGAGSLPDAEDGSILGAKLAKDGIEVERGLV